MKYIILIIAVLISHNISACENTRLSFALGSYHLTTNYKPENLGSYNQKNIGLSFECGLSDNIFIDVGFYKNSLYKTSIHTSLLFRKRYNDIEVGYNTGLISGYSEKVQLYIRPYIQYKNLRIGYIPEVEKMKIESVLTFEIIIEL